MTPRAEASVNLRQLHAAASTGLSVTLYPEELDALALAIKALAEMDEVDAAARESEEVPKKK